MGLFQTLKDDHKELRSLCEKLLATTPRARKRRSELLHRLDMMLMAHTKAEEQALYDKLKPFEKLRDLAMEGYEEHHVASMVLNELTVLDPEDEHWRAKMEVLSEALNHHIGKEENDVFPKARKAIPEARHEDHEREYLELKFAFIEPASPGLHPADDAARIFAP